VNAIIDSAVIIAITLLFCGAGIWVVRKFFHRIDFSQHHAVAGYLLGVVGVMFSIVLGLIVVSVQGKFEQARVMAETEASCCSDIMGFARGLPPAFRKKIRPIMHDYYETVQDENWEAVSHGGADKSTVLYEALWTNVAAFEPQGSREIDCYQEILNTMKDFSDTRHFRSEADQHALSPFIWLVLITGAVLTLLFLYFFWIENVITQTVLIVFVGLFLALNLLLIRLFDNPYRNEFGIKDGAFGLNANVFFPPSDGRAQ
jgi:Protein of unknown function (DUF4239)